MRISPRAPLSFLLLAAAACGLLARAPAQNLVPNPSLETYTTCPITIGQTSKCVAWSSPTNGTPDYFNACHTGPTVGVPTNVWGSQAAHSGKGYASCIVYIDAASFVGEYVEAKLISPMVAGQNYEISYWVSLTDKSRFAVAEMGAYLSVGSVAVSSSVFPLPYTPQIENPSSAILNSKTTWTEIKGTYTAVGGEDHIVLGCFKAGTVVTKQNVGGLNKWANYYIDDVSVVPLGGGGTVTKPHVIGWSDLPVSPAVPGYLDLQNVANGCQKAYTRCRTLSLQKALTAYAGGTAYDPRRRSVWASDGRVVAEYYVDAGQQRSCRPRCKPFVAAVKNARALVSGLAHGERRGVLFQLATTSGYAELTTYDNRGACPGKFTTCGMALPKGALAGGLAYDEVTDLLFVSVSVPNLAKGYTTELWVAAADSPCRILCRRKLFTCTTKLVTGLAYDGCRKHLYATDGQVTQTFGVADAKRCVLKIGGCCKKQTQPIYRGLCVISGWVRRTYGKPCAQAPCATCRNLNVSTVGDPSLGGTFEVRLNDAPTGALAFLFGKVGGCGAGVQLPSPFCGKMYGDPGQILFPGLQTTGRTKCDGRAGLALPIPAAAQLKGIPICLQWYFVCRGSAGRTGMGLSPAIEFAITGG